MSEPMADKPLSRDACVEMLERLPSVAVDEQLAILDHVFHDADQDLRQRALGLGAAVLSDRRLVDLVRDDADDVRRNAGLAMLKMRRSRARRLAIRLLADDDPDVVIQAVQVLGHLADLRAIEPLRSALRHPDANVVQEAILALGRIGHPKVLEDLGPFLEADAWIASAAIESVGLLGGPGAVPHLAPCLDDPVLAAFAWEAIARVGGHGAFDVLARRWLIAPDDLEPAQAVALLVQVLERAGTPPFIEGLDEALERFETGEPSLAALAHRCRLLLRHA